MRLTVDDIKRQTKSETKLIKARKVQQDNKGTKRVSCGSTDGDPEWEVLCDAAVHLKL